jgi:hypothetical protein
MLCDIMSLSIRSACPSQPRVLAYRPMSLHDDLKPLLDKFLEEDRAEGERRKTFGEQWSAFESKIKTSMHQVETLLAESPFKSEIRQVHDSIALNLVFTGSTGTEVAHTIAFGPDPLQKYILCQSTLGENRALVLAHLDEALVDRKIKIFFTAFLEFLRNPAPQEDNSPREGSAVPLYLISSFFVR